MKHLSIVAEYVETEEQKAALHALGVDYMQGYLVGQAPAAGLAAGISKKLIYQNAEK